MFGIDEDERNVSTGMVELKLSVLDLPLQPFRGWLYLQDQNKAADAVGEILLSLSYLPTAERLTVVVVKAKNLIWTNDKTTADPFVKVYLLQDGRKMSKKKTAVKRDDPNPVFNEAMIFSVPAIVLQVRCAGASQDSRPLHLFCVGGTSSQPPSSLSLIEHTTTCQLVVRVVDPGSAFFMPMKDG